MALVSTVKKTYAHIVLGVGSAAAYWLGRASGTDVLAIEQFRLGHDRGQADTARLRRGDLAGGGPLRRA